MIGNQGGSVTVQDRRAEEGNLNVITFFFLVTFNVAGLLLPWNVRSPPEEHSLPPAAHSHPGGWLAGVILSV